MLAASNGGQLPSVPGVHDFVCQQHPYRHSYQQAYWACMCGSCLSLPAGVYLDSDIECWREAYDMLEGFDFVGQVGWVFLCDCPAFTGQPSGMWELAFDFVVQASLPLPGHGA